MPRFLVAYYPASSAGVIDDKLTQQSLFSFPVLHNLLQFVTDLQDYFQKFSISTIFNQDTLCCARKPYGSTVALADMSVISVARATVIAFRSLEILARSPTTSSFNFNIINLKRLIHTFTQVNRG